MRKAKEEEAADQAEGAEEGEWVRRSRSRSRSRRNRLLNNEAGGSNEGFCSTDAVCSICSLSCSVECSVNAACDFIRGMSTEEVQAYMARYLVDDDDDGGNESTDTLLQESLKFSWPSHDNVNGLRSQTYLSCYCDDDDMTAPEDVPMSFTLKMKENTSSPSLKSSHSCDCSSSNSSILRESEI